MNKKCSWSYRSPKIGDNYMNMEVTKESLNSSNTILDEKTENMCETSFNDKIPKESTDCLRTSDEIDLGKHRLLNLQIDDYNDLNKEIKSIDLNKVANATISSEISPVFENGKEISKLESTSISTSDENDKQAALNESVISRNSSSEEEVLQRRFDKNRDVGNSPKSSASFVSVSTEQSLSEKDSEIKKRPIVIQATACNEKISVDHKDSDSIFKVNKDAEKSGQKEDATDLDNCNSLSMELDNSNIETESSFLRNSIQVENKNSNFDKTRNENKIPSHDVTKAPINEISLDQDIKKINEVSPEIIIQNFFNGSFDITAYMPEKATNHQMKHLMSLPYTEKKRKRKVNKNMNYNKELYNHKSKAEYKRFKNYEFFDDSNDKSMTNLKRRALDKHAENSKKAKLSRGKNKDEVSNKTDLLKNKGTKTKSENKYSKANNQNKREKNQSQYNEDITILNNFGMREGNKNNKTRSNAAKAKTQKNEVFKDFSHKFVPSKKSRNLRNSSLVASKKIKEIEKLENADSCEEILDSHNSDFNISAKDIADNFRSILDDQKRSKKKYAKNELGKDKFDNEDYIDLASSSDSFQQNDKTQNKLGKDKFRNEYYIDISSSDSFQPYIETKRKLEKNRKYKNKFEDAVDVTAKRQLKKDNLISKEKVISDTNQFDFSMYENDDAYENWNDDKVDSRRQGKSVKTTKSKLLEYGKISDKAKTSGTVTKPSKTEFKPSSTDTMNCETMTRSKRKTWAMLEKELLGESNETQLSNNVTKTALLKKERSIPKRNTKDADLYPVPDKSMLQIISTPARKKKYETQDTKNKYLPASDNMQSNKIVPCKSKNIIEKTIAAMGKCTEKFLPRKESITEKEWMNTEIEFEVIDEINTEQEAEFHSNMMFVANKNEQYYKNEIIAILKQPSSKKNKHLQRRDTRDKYGSNDAEHLVKRSIITESYSVRENMKEKSKSKDRTLIPSSDNKQNDPWTKLIQELNLQSNNENKNKTISSGKSLAYPDNFKPYAITDLKTEKERQLTIDLNERRSHKPNVMKKEETKQKGLKQNTYKETSTPFNHLARSNDLTVEGNCVTNDIKNRRSNINKQLDNKYAIDKMEKTSKKSETKERQTHQKKNVDKSPRFKLHVGKDGGVKFKQCKRSLSSSSEESVRQKSNSTRHEKNIPKNYQTVEKQKYTKYLRNLFEGKKSPKERSKREARSIIGDKSPTKYPVEDNNEQKKMTKTLIAKNDDDVFSLSSSDSETLNKGTGLLCDVFDE